MLPKRNSITWVFHRRVLMTSSSVSPIWWSCPLLCLVALLVASQLSSSSMAQSSVITPSSTSRPCPCQTWCTLSSHSGTSMRSCSLRAMGQWQVWQRYVILICNERMIGEKLSLFLGLFNHFWCNDLQHLHCNKRVYHHSCDNRQVSQSSIVL